MFWTLVDALERHLFNALFTAFLLLACAGLCWWIWLDRFDRFEPDASELVEIRGLASSPQGRNRSQSVWFSFNPSSPRVEGLPAPEQLRVHTRDVAGIEAALAKGPVPVVAWIVRAEIGRGPRDEPPSVLQLQAGNRTLLPLAAGQELRAERAANARMSAWIAIAGIVVSLIALIVHWVWRLRA